MVIESLQRRVGAQHQVRQTAVVEVIITPACTTTIEKTCESNRHRHSVTDDKNGVVGVVQTFDVSQRRGCAYGNLVQALTTWRPEIRVRNRALHKVVLINKIAKRHVFPIADRHFLRWFVRV